MASRAAPSGWCQRSSIDMAIIFQTYITAETIEKMAGYMATPKNRDDIADYMGIASTTVSSWLRKMVRYGYRVTEHPVANRRYNGKVTYRLCTGSQRCHELQRACCQEDRGRANIRAG